MPTAPIVLTTPADLDAGVTVPAWTTAEYTDANGNVVAHFVSPRPYDKRCNVSHFADHGYAFPLTVTFTDVLPEPDAALADADDFANPKVITVNISEPA